MGDTPETFFETMLIIISEWDLVSKIIKSRMIIKWNKASILADLKYIFIFLMSFSIDAIKWNAAPQSLLKTAKNRDLRPNLRCLGLCFHSNTKITSFQLTSSDLLKHVKGCKQTKKVGHCTQIIIKIISKYITVWKIIQGIYRKKIIITERCVNEKCLKLNYLPIDIKAEVIW